MGCGGSKATAVKGGNPLEFNPKEINENRPDQIRREISEVYQRYLVKRDQIKPLLAEKYGINALIEEERVKSNPLL